MDGALVDDKAAGLYGIGRKRPGDGSSGGKESHVDIGKDSQPCLLNGPLGAGILQGPAHGTGGGKKA